MTNEATPRPCDHTKPNTAITMGAMGTDYNVSWCRHCGAFRVRDSKWELPQENYVAQLENLNEYNRRKVNAHDAMLEALIALAMEEK